MNTRVVITGAGTISALGNNWQSVKAALRAGKNCVRTMPEWDIYPELRTRLAAPIDTFEQPSHYRKKQTRSMGRVALMAVSSAEMALENAGLLNDPIIKSGLTGVAFGSATGNSPATCELSLMLTHQSMDNVNATTYLRMMSHTAAVNISVFFGTTGRMYTTSSACTAGSQGIGYAYEAIKNNQQKVMIAGGADELCPTQAAVFDTVLASSTKNDAPETSPRPFDTQRDGLVLGEGACTLILENREHALQRGANIIAEVIGFGTNTDGAHLIRPQRSTMCSVMQLALQDAEINKKQIGYVSAHGTATEHGDIAESLATTDALHEAVPTSSLKSYTGHTLGSCGSFEAWASIMMMNDNWFAPTVNLTEVDPKCANLDFIQADGRHLETDTIMSNNFAFGGINTSLIFKRV